MINLTHFVLDLETMGKGPLAAIVAIGCVRVDNGQITGEFYERVSLESSMRHGGLVDASTVEWWLQQAPEVRAEINGSLPQEQIAGTLGRLNKFMLPHDQSADTNLVWGNGSSFDNVILRSAYSHFGYAEAWRFWNDRDLRTLLAIFPASKRAIAFEGTKHNALDDARHEARQLCHALAPMASQTAPAELREALLFAQAKLRASGRAHPNATPVLVAEALERIDQSLTGEAAA